MICDNIHCLTIEYLTIFFTNQLYYVLKYIYIYTIYCVYILCCRMGMKYYSHNTLIADISTTLLTTNGSLLRIHKVTFTILATEKSNSLHYFPMK